MTQPIDLAAATTSAFDPTPGHAWFTKLAGPFRGTTRTWFDPEAEPERADVDAFGEVILGGRFARLRSRSIAMGKPPAGELTFAYEVGPARYSASWIDSFHTASTIMLFVGTAMAEDAVSFLGSYEAEGQRWGWRTVIQPTPRGLALDSFNVMPDGVEHRALETRLERA